ncbi:hypothetical protein NKH77_48280 [Streptomyces sp. M19]
MTGVFAVWTADLAVAPARFEEAREVALACGEERVALFTGPYLGAMRALCGEVDEGWPPWRRAATHRRGERPARHGRDPLRGALLRAVLGDIDGALEMCDAGLAHLEHTGDRQFYSSTLMTQGVILWLAGRHDQSAPSLRRALEAVSEIDDVLVAALCCLGLAWHAARYERHPGRPGCWGTRRARGG